MVSCPDCGRWISATNFARHQVYHQAQRLLDHTGPHGVCDQKQVAPQCSCPDPVYSGRDAICCCCDGMLNNPFVTL